MGSDKYVFLDVEVESATSADLDELAKDTGNDLEDRGADLVTRFSAESRVKAGSTATVWLNLDKIHVFDPFDGRNVTLEDGKAAGVTA